MSWHSQEKFNSNAAGWDDNPRRLAIAEAVAAALIESADPKPTMRVLEFGCGTGLVTLRIAPRVGSLTAVDTSSGMLDVLKAKLQEAGLCNVEPRTLDLTAPEAADTLGEPFELIYSSMTLHHIADTGAFLQRLAGMLKPGGMLAVADLDLEDGFFHDDAEEQVHPGFERTALSALFEAAGFARPAFVTAHVITKKNRAGNDASYPVFLATARLTRPAVSPTP